MALTMHHVGLSLVAGPFHAFYRDVLGFELLRIVECPQRDWRCGPPAGACGRLAHLALGGAVLSWYSTPGAATCA